MFSLRKYISEILLNRFPDISKLLINIYRTFSLINLDTELIKSIRPSEVSGSQVFPSVDLRILIIIPQSELESKSWNIGGGNHFLKS